MTKKNIIIIAVILVVIAGAFLTLHLLDNLEIEDDEPIDVWEIPETVFVLGGDDDAPFVLNVEVHNEHGSFSIYNSSPDEPPFDFELKGFEDVETRRSMILNITTIARRLRASDVLVEDGGEANLAEFGLLNPSITVYIDYLDGTSEVLLIGDFAPGDMGAYAMRQGGSTVYLISRAQANSLNVRGLDFVERNIVEMPGFMPEITRVILGGSSRPEPIVVEEAVFDEDDTALRLFSHVIVEPVNMRLHSTFGFEPLVHAFGLDAFSVEAIITSPDELSAWGLYEPYSTIEMFSDSHDDFKLLASAPDEDGFVYIMRYDRPLVYRVREDQLSWYRLTYFGMMDKLLILPHIDSVSNVEIHLPGRMIDIRLEGEGQYLEVFVDGVPYTTNDEDIDPIRNFRTLYQAFLATSYESIPDQPKPANAAVLLRIVYVYRNNSPSDTVTIFEGAARRVFVQLNDETPMLGLSSHVDYLLANIERFLAGDEVRTLF